MLDHSADVHLKTAFFNAAKAGCEGIAALFLEHGADVDLQNNDSETAILISAARGDMEVVIGHGADTNLKTNLETWLSRSRLHIDMKG